jgi:FkbM family methyltransferase
MLKILLIQPGFSFNRHFNHLESVIKLIDKVYGAKCTALICNKAVNACGYMACKASSLPETFFKKNDYCNICVKKIEKRIKPFCNSKIYVTDCLTQDDYSSIDTEIEKLPKLLKVKDIINIRINDVQVGIDIWESIQYHLYIGTPEYINFEKYSIAYEFIRSGYIYAYAMNKIFRDNKFDLVISNEIKDIDWGIPDRYALKNKIPVIYQLHTYLGVQLLNTNLITTLDELKKHPTFLSKNDISDQNFNKNTESGLQIIKNLITKIENNSDDKEVLISNFFSTTKKNVVIFAHQCFDAAFTYGDRLFVSFEDWLTFTYKIAVEVKNINWIFKVHPSEHRRKVNNYYNTSIHLDMLKNKYPSGNIKIIYSDINLSSLYIYPYVHAGITTIGSVGYEYPALGVPILTAARVGYIDMGFTTSPNNIEEYKQQLINIEKIPKLTKIQQNNAVAYAGFLYNEKRFLDVKDLFNTKDSSDNYINKRKLKKWLLKTEAISYIKRKLDRLNFPVKEKKNLRKKISEKMKPFGLPKIANKKKYKVIIINDKDIPKSKFKVYNTIEQYRTEMYGEEEIALKYFLSLIKHDSIVYDIGASIGLFAITSAILCEKGKLFAFEPDKETCQRLEENIKFNNLKNIKINELALSDNKTESLLYTNGTNGYAPTLVFQKNRKDAPKNTIIIKTDTLDNLLKNNSYPVPDIIKIDIEGAEILLVKGAQKLFSGELNKRPEHIFIEIHPEFLIDFDSSENEVIDIIQSHGYKIVWKMKRENQFHIHFML